MIDVIISFTDRETQQQLRLCSKQFDRLTTPRYFRKFRFRLSQLSLDGLISIANHPEIAKYVQDLEFNSHQLLWFFDLDSFLRKLDLQPGQPWRPIPGLKHIPTQDFDRSQLHQIYAAYASERDTPADYVECILSHPESSNPLIPHTYPNLPHAFASLPNLHTITATFGMPHQQYPPTYAHTWRGLTFTQPDPDPPGDRDIQKAIDLSCLLHALSQAAANRLSPLPLRTLILPIIGYAIFGPSSLRRLWEDYSITSHVMPDLWTTGSGNGGIQATTDANGMAEVAIYSPRFRAITAVFTGLTRLDLRIDWTGSNVGGTARMVWGLAAMLERARGLEELALAVQRDVVPKLFGWRQWTPEAERGWRTKDVLLVLVGGEHESDVDDDNNTLLDWPNTAAAPVDVRWPRLRKLTLGVQTTQDGLLGLLGRVAGSLRSLTLSNMRFMPRLGDWDDALRQMRGLLELEQLEMNWLMHIPDFSSAEYKREAMLMARDIEAGCVDDEMAEKRYRMTYRHYEAQAVDYVLKRSEIVPELDQGAFFRDHPEDCDWCEERILENKSR
ncbi:Chromatin modification-related protein eaf7 [Lasiodiplodia theobromae]|uniref:Chromatin modification-related protein eaf7 n=1 Tax=Lasiodiplodia theobromae TaxID=45133 RepID=UPI0015C2FA52|nr:Chromatin modification-related protein eaf7 [Lasiodiplodia theobromae]KAF4533829.1 Chromatin modification-related protein eaf7 [Lasiodiplodia theobromae]